MTASDANPSQASHAQTQWSRWLGAGLIVSCALVRLLATHSLLPWWEMDPLTSWRPETTLTPAIGFMLDAAVWIGALLVLVSTCRACEPVRWKTGLLVMAGVVGVTLHGAVLRPLAAGDAIAPRGDFASLSLGSAWAAAFVGAWALVHAATDRSLRRVAALVLISVIAILCAKGAYQTLVEHPRVVASFDADPGAMLASRGWEPGSTSARLFERRLRQTEASGWFGLANVYGSLAAACAVAWLTITIGAWRASRRRLIGSGEAGLISLMAIAACAALFMSGSKGALGAGVVGLSCAFLPSLGLPGFRLARFIAPWLGFLIVATVILLVLVRGAVGERVGELSMLFRSQYFSGASTIITEHPVLGVGPAGFKDAYLRAKLPNSPEEIESPHSLPFDFLARLGLFGGAWVLLWLICLKDCGIRFRHAIQPASGDDESRTQMAGSRWAAGCLILAVTSSLAIERAVFGLDFALLLIVSALAAWFTLTVAMRACAADFGNDFGRWVDRGMCAAAFALAAHAMIEVTPVTPGSSAWFFAIFALAGRSLHQRYPAPDSHQTSTSLPFLGACAAVLFGATGVTYSAALAWQWERALRNAALAVRPVGEFHDAISLHQASPKWQAEALQTIRRLASTAGVPAPKSDADLLRLLRRLQARAIPKALHHIDQATALIPTAWDARFAGVRLEMALAFDHAQGGENLLGARRADGALARMGALVDARHASATAWGRLGALRTARASLPFFVATREAELAAAQLAWESTARLDPHGLGPALALWKVAVERDDEQGTLFWGQRSIEIDKALRLDPIKGLTDSERSAVLLSLDLTSTSPQHSGSVPPKN